MTKIVLFNKPYDVVSQFRETTGRSTLADYIHDPQLRIAGRLDRDSEGLIVLTDSGTLAHKITHPDKSMSKTYWAQIEGAPTHAHLAPLAAGIELGDGPCKPAKYKMIEAPPALWPRSSPIRIRKSIPDRWLELTIEEGRNRQVRRMCAHIGFPVLRLIRYRVGSWTIDGLAPGESVSLVREDLA